MVPSFRLIAAPLALIAIVFMAILLGFMPSLRFVSAVLLLSENGGLNPAV